MWNSKEMRVPRRTLCYTVVIFFVWTAGGSSKVSRDWTKYPAVVEVEAPGDIWAIGDGHGDYERLAALLKTAGLIPSGLGSETREHSDRDEGCEAWLIHADNVWAGSAVMIRRCSVRPARAENNADRSPAE